MGSDKGAQQAELARLEREQAEEIEAAGGAYHGRGGRGKLYERTSNPTLTGRGDGAHRLNAGRPTCDRNTGTRPNGRPRKDGEREPSGKLKRAPSAKNTARLMFWHVWNEGYVAQARYPHVSAAVTAGKLKPEDGLIALYWIALNDRGARNNWDLMARATRATGFEFTEDEGANKARAYIENRLGTDATAILDAALLYDNRCNWREVATTLADFWAAMLEHGRRDNKHANYDLEEPDHRYTHIKAVAECEFSKDVDLYDWK
jgi:hypothetical protein